MERVCHNFITQWHVLGIKIERDNDDNAAEDCDRIFPYECLDLVEIGLSARI